MATYTKGKKLFTKSSILSVIRKHYNENLKVADVLEILEENGNEADEMMAVIKQYVPAKEVTVETVKDKLSAGYISGEEMCRLVAKSTYLTTEDVREVFRTYRNVVESLIDSDSFINYSFSIPYFAVVQTKYIAGRKAGTKTKVPYSFLLKDPKAEGYRIDVVEEDEPGHDTFHIKIKSDIKDKLKERSKERYAKALKGVVEDEYDNW